MSDILKKALESTNGVPETAEWEPVSPPSSLRERVLAAATLEGRLSRFADEAARMLDLPQAKAQRLLDLIDTPDSFAQELPGVEFFWLPGGPKTLGSVRGFVRVDRAAVLPEHEHMGAEQVLVLQGTYIDTRSGERFGPGALLHGDEGTTHEFTVDPAGTDLLLLVVVDRGYRIGELRIETRDK